MISKNNIEWSSPGAVLNIKPISNTRKPLYMLAIYDLYNKRLILRWKRHIIINIRFLKSVQVWVLGRAPEYWWADETVRWWERCVLLIFSIMVSLGSSSRCIFIWLQGMNTAFVLFWVMWRQDVTRALPAAHFNILKSLFLPRHNTTWEY